MRAGLMDPAGQAPLRRGQEWAAEGLAFGLLFPACWGLALLAAHAGYWPLPWLPLAMMAGSLILLAWALLRRRGQRGEG
jgi:hypothetical protein